MSTAAKLLYKILKQAREADGDFSFDWLAYLENLSEQYGEGRIKATIARLVDAKLLTGIEVTYYLNEPSPTVIVKSPSITVDGISYLEENSTMKKAEKLFRGIINAS